MAPWKYVYLFDFFTSIPLAQVVQSTTSPLLTKLEDGKYAGGSIK